MTVESEIAALSTAATALVNAVALQQIQVSNSVSAFELTTVRVNTGLNLVDNTSDINKPVSTALLNALELKQPLLKSGVNISTVNGISLLDGKPIVISRSATSISAVSYLDRGTLRLSVNQVDDSVVVEGLGLFMWVSSKEEPDDDETCFTTSSGQWLLSLPAVDLLNAWNMHDSSYEDDWREDEPNRFADYILSIK
jgi:hypothetical protein